MKWTRKVSALPSAILRSDGMGALHGTPGRDIAAMFKKPFFPSEAGKAIANYIFWFQSIEIQREKEVMK